MKRTWLWIYPHMILTSMLPLILYYYGDLSSPNTDQPINHHFHYGFGQIRRVVNGHQLDWGRKLNSKIEEICFG